MAYPRIKFLSQDPNPQLHKYIPVHRHGYSKGIHSFAAFLLVLGLCNGEEKCALRQLKSATVSNDSLNYAHVKISTEL